MDGADLVGGYGKGGLCDHGPEGILLDADGILVLHLRQLRVVLRGQGQDVVGSVAAGELDVEVLVRGEGDNVVRQAADDLPEEPRGEHQGTRLGDVRVQAGADACLHVVAGYGELVVRMEQKAF